MAIIEKLVKDIADFLQEDPNLVYEKIEREIFNKGSIVAEAWKKFAPRTIEEIGDFYRKTDAYLYELLIDHQKDYRREIRRRILERLAIYNAKTVLDYGGGVGLDSTAMSKAGMDVTFYEMNGITLKFAKMNFAREKCTVQIRNSVNEIAPNSFDSVICIEVLEHVPNPPAVIADIHRLLKMGGIALITESFEDGNDRYASHLAGNKKYAGKIFKMMELQGFALTARWPDNKPLEFTKMSRNMHFHSLRIKRRAGILSDLVRKAMGRLAQIS